MSIAKTKIDKKEVYNFLLEKFSPDISNIKPIEVGETSRVFVFKSKKQNFIIRFNFKKLGFQKDEYAYKNFCSKVIPIPKTLQLGKFSNGVFYAITYKAKGKIVDDFVKKDIMKFMPSIVKTLNAIHNVKINSTKFGDWDDKGVAKYNSWQEYLEGLPDDFKVVDDDIILEKSVVKKILKTYKTLIPFCPNTGHLVHGDFGFNNLLVHNGKVSGVIDWELAKYGDFLYDVAWLSFCGGSIDYASIFLQWYNDHGVEVLNFPERILCYKLHFGLWALDFYSRSKQKDKYERTKKRVLKLAEYKR